MRPGDEEINTPPSTKRLRFGLITAGVLVAGLGIALVLTGPPDESAPNDPATGQSPASSATAPSDSVEPDDDDPVAPVVDKLRDREATVTITILGDSTGDADDEWVARLAQGISAKYDRTVAYSAWDIATAAYAPSQNFGRGEAAGAVSIWNGSAAGQGPFYSQTHLREMAPEPSDLIIISHGHNFTDPAGGAAKEAQLASLAASEWDNSPQMVIVLQNARTTRATVQDANMSSLSAVFADTEYTVVDVYAAFKAEPNLAGLLLDDGVHPNAAGQTLWFETVVDSLGF